MAFPGFVNAVGQPSRLNRPRKQTTQVYEFPSPIGVNALAPLAAMGPEDCIYSYNLLPAENGLESREGYIEWANSLGTPIAPEVRTIVPFVGDREDRFNDRLFALNDNGIFNVSSQGVDGVSPPQVFTWANQGGTSGYAIYTHYTNDAGTHYLMLADENNGLHEYDETTGTWVATTGITGPVIGNIFFVTSHQQRLWLVEKDSSNAWYLPTGAKAGTATAFNFGSIFREGGNLAGLFSWTADGGDGVNDYLVAVSREGGVAIYQGSDPANAATWALVGVWYIGRVPVGHRFASEYGGELYLLSERGLVSINQLLQGASVLDAANAKTGKISRLVRTELGKSLEQRGWEIRQVPRKNHYVLNTPLSAGLEAFHLSYVQHTGTLGWGISRGVPSATGDVFQGRYFFADVSGSVYVQSGGLDNVRLDGTPGEAVPFSMLTSFSSGSWPGFKIGQYCRPHFISAGKPSFSVQARWDFDLNENSKGLLFSPIVQSVWDAGLWDSATWAGGATGVEAVQGISNQGHYLAIALKGQTEQSLILAAIEVQYEPGGGM